MLSSGHHSSPQPREELMFHSTNRLCVIGFKLRRTPLSTTINCRIHRTHVSFITIIRASTVYNISLRCIDFPTSDPLHLHGVSGEKITSPNLDLILPKTVQNLCIKFSRKDNSLAVCVTLLKRPHARSDYRRLTKSWKINYSVHLANLYCNGLQFSTPINDTSTMKIVCSEMAAATYVEETTSFYYWFQVRSVTQLPTGKHTASNFPTVGHSLAVDVSSAGGTNIRVCLGQSLNKNGLGHGPMGHGYCFADPNHFTSPLSLGVLDMGIRYNIRQVRPLQETYPIGSNVKCKQLRLSLIVIHGSRLSSRLFLPDNSLLRSKTVIYFRSLTLLTGFVYNVGQQSGNLVFSRTLVLGSKMKLLYGALHFAELVSLLDVFYLMFYCNVNRTHITVELVSRCNRNLV